mgnify:FL=1
MTADGAPRSDTDYPEASVAAKTTTSFGDILELTYEKLNTEVIIASVKDDGAGAIAVFIGTTRDSFQGELRLLLQEINRLRYFCISVCRKASDTIDVRSLHSAVYEDIRQDRLGRP